MAFCVCSSREEIEHRFGGDLLPYQQFDLGMGVASGCGLKTAVPHPTHPTPTLRPQPPNPKPSP
eukprot:3498842-Rhodomonas_salina.2